MWCSKQQNIKDTENINFLAAGTIKNIKMKTLYRTCARLLCNSST